MENTYELLFSKVKKIKTEIPAFPGQP